MKLSSVIFYVLIIGVLFSCKNGNNQKKTVDSIKSEPYYPVVQYIQDQIKYVDTTPLAIEKITLVNNKQIDSIIIDRNSFHELAQEFLKPDLNNSSIKPLFEENKYHDLTINSLTFSYSSLDSAQPLQQLDVLLDPETQKVKNVLFRKILHHRDTVITLNGLWKNNMNFQLNYLIQPPNDSFQSKQIKVIWDKRS